MPPAPVAKTTAAGRKQSPLPPQPSAFAVPHSSSFSGPSGSLNRELPPLPQKHLTSIEKPMSSLSLDDSPGRGGVAAQPPATPTKSVNVPETIRKRTQETATHAETHNEPSMSQWSNDKVITYQYALRYAMLLDADSAQLAARTRTTTNKQGGVSSAANLANFLNTGTSNGFAVKSVGVASGTGIANNRTPTLVAPRRGSVSETGDSAALDARAKGKRWKTGLLGLGDSAARKIKAEVGSASKLKSLAKGITGSSKGLSPKQSREGDLSPAIIKALVQHLKSATGVASLHPLTRECYIAMNEYLRVKEHSEALSETGTINDLLDAFAEQSQTVCVRHGITSEPDSTNTIDSQLSRFIKLLRSVLQAKAHTSREAGLALLKLDDVPEPQISGSSVPQGAQTPISLDSRGRSNSMSVEETASVDSVAIWIRNAFQVMESEHAQIVGELKKEVNQETATQDLRMCLLVLKKDMSFAGKPDHFRTPSAYRIWKDREITSLEQLIHTYSVRQSFMSGENISAGRLKLEASAIEALGDEEIAAAFEYIPAHAAQHYRRMIQIAIYHDIVGALAVSSDSASGSVSISSGPTAPIQLSNPAKELLKQLGIAWRISAPFRETCYLDIINDYYEQGMLPESYLLDAFTKVERIVHLMDPHDWHISQYETLLEIEGRIEYGALGRVQDVIEELDQQRPERNASLKKLLRSLMINDVTCPVVPNRPMPNIDGRRKEVMSILEPSIKYRYECLSGQCFSNDSISTCLDGYAQLAVHILRDCERCHGIFSDSLLEDGDRRYDIPGIVAEIGIDYFYAYLIRHVGKSGYTVQSADVEATFELCGLITKIERLYKQASDREIKGIDNRRLFREAIESWMRNIDHEKAKWADNALKLDSYPRELSVGKHSTSVIDLISCFSQQVSIATHLEWPDIETKVVFLTQFMKHVDITFEVYAAMMLKQFINCLSLQSEEDDAADQKGTGWNSMWNSRKYKEQSLNLNTATQTAITKLDLSKPVEISKEACVKLNNLSVAKTKLHELHKELGIREAIEAVGSDNRESIKKEKPKGYLLSFEVVRAEGLEMFKKRQENAAQASCKPYVKLATTRNVSSDVAKRKTFAKTRPSLSGATNPRWQESFDLQLGTGDELVAPLEARICTRDGPKALGNREKTRARAYFAPPTGMALATDGSVDMVLDLEPSGHLMLQVTMDGERDDVEFYSGRMFRFIDRTLSDMQQRIVEQVSSSVREYLGHILVSQATRYRTSRVFGSRHVSLDRGIERSVQFLKRGGHTEPATIKITQESCCEALIPLIDYLEANLHALFVHLYDETADGVIIKVWNDMLVSLEDILLPPLRGESKGSAKPLTESDLNNIFDCLDFLKWYFEGGSDKDGIPTDTLENRKFNELLMVYEMYFMTSRELIDSYMVELRGSVVEPKEVKIIESKQLLSPASIQSSDFGAYADNSPRRSSMHPSGGDAGSNFVSAAKRSAPPPLPPRTGSGDSVRPHRLSNRDADADAASCNSSTDTLPIEPQDVCAAIMPTPAKKSALGRSRSVWVHKDAETLTRFKRSNRMVTDKGDLILRLLRLRFDKEASKFVQTQLELRAQQMQYEMRRAVKRSSQLLE
ncbi:hypothetical protein LPJ72_003709 [Coemansia sp. Benny D160-2]|nr:hypothetical protein LPJ72_003709 [Coemansia sp. Benny D160-2]